MKYIPRICGGDPGQILFFFSILRYFPATAGYRPDTFVPGHFYLKKVSHLLDARVCTCYNNIIEGRNNENTRIAKAFEEK